MDDPEREWPKSGARNEKDSRDASPPGSGSVSRVRVRRGECKRNRRQDQTLVTPSSLARVRSSFGLEFIVTRLRKMQREPRAILGSRSILGNAVDFHLVRARFHREQHRRVDAVRNIDHGVETVIAFFAEIDLDHAVRRGFGAACPVEVEQIRANGRLVEIQAQ